ncbi:uncharacterized protein MYU51_012541 [Penicillium brevicompactum]
MPQHVKSAGDGKRPTCTRCKRSASSCVWQAVPSGFRHGSSARYDADFADDQVWVPIAQDYKYVDETADVAREYSLELGEETPWALERYDVCLAVEQPDLTESSIASDAVASFPSGPWATQPDRTSVDLYHSPPNSYSISPVSVQAQISPSSYTIPISENLVATETGLANFDEHEACLMRYFVVQLGHWFDICDGQRHFACTVPVRALTCPPLLNAIYTISARHLSKSKKYYVGNQIKYGGKYLPGLTPATALEYHNRCISYFVSLSDHSQEAGDENLLAAAVILRFYEEVDLPAMGEDTESALRGIQIFLDAQATPAVVGTSLRHAAYWVALRQEIITAFSKQRPFRLPLGPCDPYRTFEPADDYVWADRLVIHCADVLQFCFGSEEESHSYTPSPESRITRYDTLVSFETLWTEMGPSSFNPVYARDPDPARGEVFPELWYLNNCHVAGLQHLELARILLAVYNPRLPRLGPGQRTAMRSVDAQVRTMVLRLCGIAMSNLHSPPGLVTASAAIGMCGDRFVEKVEQEALFGVLVRLEDEYGYPTHNMRTQLREAWA